MKTITVNEQIVQFNNGRESDKLTPAMARSAVRILYGHLTRANVTDSKTGYKVYKSRTRRMTAEEEHDAGIDS